MMSALGKTRFCKPFLAIIFGVSFLDTLGNKPVISKSILFLISNITFFIIIGYMVSLGIVSGIRFHYMRNLEDQLYMLIHGNNRETGLLHWMSFSSSITTRNIKHLTSIPAWIHYLCYALATVCAILFCVITTFFQYINLDTPSLLDNIAFVALSTFSALVSIAFFYASVNSKKIYLLAVRISRERRNGRLRGLNDVQQDSAVDDSSNDGSGGNGNRRGNRYILLMKAIVYFIYPKTQDMQKPLLIVLGFCTAVILNGTSFQEHGLRQLAFTVLMLDVLAYQARFQWNDIRGLYEDKEAGKTNRLPFWFFGEKKAVFISLSVIFARLLIFAFLAFRTDKAIKAPVLTCAALIAIIAVFYEIARTKEVVIPVFALVSLGYPLRLFAGFWVACPEFWRQRDLLVAISVILLSYAFFGEFSVLLTWTHEAVSQKKAGKPFKKRHYEYLFQKVESRGNFPLSNHGKLFDPWNFTFFGSVATFSIALIIKCEFFVMIELIFLASLAFLCLASKKQSYFIAPLAIGLGICKTVWGYSASQAEIVYISITQLLFVSIYYFLRFIVNPDFDLALFCRNLVKKLLILIISEKTWALLSGIDE